MKNTTKNLLYRYLEHAPKVSISDSAADPLNALEVIEILWTLNDILRPTLQQIRSMPYRAEFSKKVDLEIERLADRNGNISEIANLPAFAARVLLERHQQVLIVATANIKRKVMVHFPEGLTKHEKETALLIYFYHKMELPFPVRREWEIELPEGTFDPSLNLH